MEGNCPSHLSIYLLEFCHNPETLPWEKKIKKMDKELEEKRARYHCGDSRDLFMPEDRLWSEVRERLWCRL